MAEESVKVAVRVRPFNQREKERNAKLMIKMKDQSTFITDPNSANDTKQFTFDYSYWSHDGFKEKNDGYLEPNGPASNYSSQQKVFDDLGKGVLANAFEGFNCSLFAYGQTGSGKSYSMVGYGVNRGIVPMTCEMLFKNLSERSNKDEKYEVTFSMLEIYNEQVRDLLTKDNPKGGLQIRQHPNMGSFYAQGLKRVPVASYSEIEARIEEGTSNRTVASTNMNATSSRAHTIASITFDQVFKTADSETRKSSVINLVDLAGSERADSTGATGDRLKEGANINKSLSVLGNCISALAEISTNPKKKIVVPYRDSVLTKLLQNALGGNSKTIMIAALSPADINYDETLSTLRYADRAKQIKNRAVINENPIEKLIRELKTENERLKSIISSGQFVTDALAKSEEPMTPKELEVMKRRMEDEIKSQLQANQEMLKEVNTSWNEKLEIAQKESANEKKDFKIKEERKNHEPYLTNLNEDPMLSYVICHFIGPNMTTLGSSSKVNVQLHGLSVMENHALIKRENDEIEIKPAQVGAKIKVNGIDLTGSRVLENNDRVLFGSSNMYVFVDPNAKDYNRDSKNLITWDFAQKEIAEAKGFGSRNVQLSTDQQIIQDEIVKLLPLITEANAISEELNKYITFEVIIVPTTAMEPDGESSSHQNPQKVVVKVFNLISQTSWLWDSGKFMNRRYLMLDHYQKYLDGDEHILYIKKEDDPFWEPIENLFIGNASVFLQSLAYFMDFDDKVTITDYKGQDIGTLNTALVPCNQQGKPITDDMFNEEPSNLLSKPYSFKIMIRSCILPNLKYSKFIIKYKVFNEKDYSATQKFSQGETSHQAHLHTRIFTFPNITKDHLSFFENGFITFLIYAIQEEIKNDEKLFRMTTKELKQLREREDKKTQRRDSMLQYISGDMDIGHLKSEFILLQKKYTRLESKEKHLQKLCMDWSDKNTSYEEFFKTVCAIVNASNVKFKTTAGAISKTAFEEEQENDDAFHVTPSTSAPAKKQQHQNNDVKREPNGKSASHNHDESAKQQVSAVPATPSKTCTIT